MILTSQVMQSRGLIGLAHDTLTASTAEIAEILTHLGQARTYPVLVHCSQGKDRTGLIVALVLLLLLSEFTTAARDSQDESSASFKNKRVVPLSAIAADYALSDDGLEAERDEWIEELRWVGLGPEFGMCAPGFVSEVSRFLHEQYGGVGEYVRALGVSEEVITGIGGLLLDDEQQTRAR